MIKFRSRRNPLTGKIQRFCESPVVVFIRADGSIYLSGDYSLADLKQIVKTAEKAASKRATQRKLEGG